MRRTDGKQSAVYAVGGFDQQAPIGGAACSPLKP